MRCFLQETHLCCQVEKTIFQADIRGKDELKNKIQLRVSSAHDLSEDESLKLNRFWALSNGWKGRAANNKSGIDTRVASNLNETWLSTRKSQLKNKKSP